MNANHLIDDYLSYVSQLQERMNKGETYFHQFSEETEVLHLIEQQEREIHRMIAALKEKAESMRIVNSYIQSVRRELIPDHYLFRTVKMDEIPCEREKSKKWGEYLMPNHQINIEIRITEIMPILKSKDINPNQITFDSLRFHFHHADQSSSSPLMQYHPRHNIYRDGDLIEGKMTKDDRSISLKLRHEIRHQNLQLYQGLFEKMPLKIVVQASYGLVLGVADIYIDEVAATNQGIQNQFRCIIFNLSEYDEAGEMLSSLPVLFAKAYLSIESSPIAPLLQDLKLNAESQQKKRTTSKSKSPNRLISTSPSKGASPKKKRLLLAELSSPEQQVTHLTIFEGVEYRYKLNSAAVKREITYRQTKNIKERKVELVKVEDEYYLKCYLVRDNRAERGYIHFELNEQKFLVYAITDKLYGMVDYQTYFKAKEKKVQFHNKLVRVGNQTLVYPRESTRIIKNFVKQSTVDGLLSSIFLKTPFDECEIYTQAPFVMEDIAHKEGGYMIGYYHSTSRPVMREEQATLVFFLKSRFKQINEIHVFECTVSPRMAGRDTVYKQLHVGRGEAFCRISLELMANEKLEYQMRSSFVGVSVVNGQNYQFSSQNSDLILQVMEGCCLESGMEFDVVFTDSKLRCFFMRVAVTVEDQQQPIQKDGLGE